MCRYRHVAKQTDGNQRIADVLQQITPEVTSLRGYIFGPQTPQKQGRDADSRALARIQRLMRQSILGDADAAELLSTIATVAVASLAQATDQQPDLFRKMAMASPFWPTLLCKPPSLKGYYEKQIKELRVGENLKDAGSSRLSLENSPAFVATHVVHYLQDVRSGLLSHPNKQWVKAVRALPPLSKKAVFKWWPLASSEIARSLPDLHDWLRGTKTSPRTLGQAIQRIRTPFLQTWKLLEFIKV